MLRFLYVLLWAVAIAALIACLGGMAFMLLDPLEKVFKISLDFETNATVAAVGLLVFYTALCCQGILAVVRRRRENPTLVPAE